MIDAKQVTMILESATCLAWLMVLFLKLVPEVRLDGFRQDMFAVRDEFFDYAAAGNIGFDDPAYRLLRQLMNGYIRYAHHLTFFRTCLGFTWLRLWVPNPEPTWTIKWENALNNIKSEKVRADIVNFHERAARLVMQRLVLGSPILLILFFFAALLMTIHNGWKNLKQLCVDAASQTVSQVIDTRFLDEEAASRAAA
jgi:hypothetical protein